MRLCLLLLALAVAAADARPRPEPCALGRFLTPDGDHLLADVTLPATEAIAIDATSIEITTGCPRIAVTPRTNRRYTTIRAEWPSCAGLAGPVKLRARLRAGACDRLDVTLRTKKDRPQKRRSRAVRAAYQYDVALDPLAPWPKFRRTSRQNGQSPVRPTAGRDPWSFQTGKGIFSTPVIDGDGTIYVGSADRYFYAIGADGTQKWSRLTGEIIDSSALLDDRGRVYVGSGDGHLYALDRTSGEPAWTFTADDPSVTGGLINWFEGNVAIGADGTLYVPNDNFFTYALSRDDAGVRWRFRTADQTWSLPAVDVATGRLFMGNNNLLTILGKNTFAIDAGSGATVWDAAVNGSIAASPLLTAGGLVVVGGFDGFVHAYDAASGMPQWTFGARDHIYSSPGELPDGTIVQPSADGSVYALDPQDGSLRWQFDTRDAIRSSPAIDGDGNVYVGAGDGRLYVINPDGTLRWSIQLIDAARDDLNASPALGAEAIVIAGESGQVFSLPYDYCLSNAGDARCRRGPGEDLPDDSAALYFTTQFGRQLDSAPAEIEPNQPLTFSLFVRAAGDTVLAHIDAASTTVTVDPVVPIRTEVSGDRKFLTIVPLAPWAPKAGGSLAVTVGGQYLVNPDRVGLKFSGGEVGGTFSRTFDFAIRSVAADDALPLPVPMMPGDPAGVWEFSRVATPLPTILPSYNQIGFDSLHYLIGLVEGSSPGNAIAWAVGAKLAEGSNTTVVEPATHVLFPLQVTNNGGALTLVNESGFAIEFNAFRIPLPFFRVAGRIDGTGRAAAGLAMNVSAVCAGITFYGPFLQQLGFCNPQTDALTVFGGAELAPHAGGIQQPPTGLGSVQFSATPTELIATLTGTTLRPDEHAVALLPLETSGAPVAIDLGFVTERTIAGDGTIATVRVPFTAGTLPAMLRVYLMVDAYPAARGVVVVPLS